MATMHEQIQLERRALDTCAVSESMVAMVRAWHEGNTAHALALHDLVAELTDGMFVESNPGPVKAALALNNLSGPEMRLPMVPVSDANRERLAGILNRYTSAASGVLGAR